jgi:fatty acid synthase subunit alpha
LQDSLWQAEDIGAVFDQDPQRVCILQGPVAAKHATVKDEPIGELLGGIVSNLSKRVLDDYYGGDGKDIPVLEYLGGSTPQVPATLAGCSRVEDGSQSVVTLSDAVPERDEWLEFLSGPQPSWLRALLTSRTIAQGTHFIDNPIKRIFAPRQHQKVVITRKGQHTHEVKVYGTPRSAGPQDDRFLCVSTNYDSSARRISVQIFEEHHGEPLPLLFVFDYKPSHGSMPIHEVVEGRNRRIKEFYWNLWFPGRSYSPPDLRSRFIGPEITITADAVSRFCAAVGNGAEAFTASRAPETLAPMDFAIVTGWEVCYILLHLRRN